jgi:RecA/RadA recombinase
MNCPLQHLGVDVDTLLLCQPDSGEMALEVADSLIRWVRRMRLLAQLGLGPAVKSAAFVDGESMGHGLKVVCAQAVTTSSLRLAV